MNTYSSLLRRKFVYLSTRTLFFVIGIAMITMTVKATPAAIESTAVSDQSTSSMAAVTPAESLLPRKVMASEKLMLPEEAEESTESASSEKPTALAEPAASTTASPTSTDTVKNNMTSSLSPWMKPRELSTFQSLLQHSPFSLATAEDSSPLAERYMITGVITIDGETQIFVMDRNDQSRELVTKKPNSKSMTLINLLHDDDPSKLKATIRVNGPRTGKAPGPSSMSRVPNYPGSSSRAPASRYPGGAPASSQNTPMIPSINSNRRVITRPPISPQPGMPSGYQPRMPSNYRPRVPSGYEQDMPSNYRPSAPSGY